MGFRKFIVKTHLVLGLASGIIIVFLGLTGCILSFQREIENATQPYRFVTQEAKAFLPPSQLKDIGAAQLPGKHLHSVLYQKNGHAAQVIFYAFEPEDYYHIVYLNPYDGKVLKVKNMYNDFFYQVVQGHYYLWLPPDIGQPIVASATLIFLVMMISGLVLWWPRNKGARKQRFTIKWSARWRRKNYDLHNVLGFYMTWIAIILALTGLVFGFEWFRNAVYKTGGGEKSLIYTEPLSDTTNMNKSLFTKASVDVLWERMNIEYPNTNILEVHIPASNSSVIEVAANPDATTYWETDYRYFDQHSLKELNVGHIYGRLKNTDAADKLIRMNYDIHTGAIWGLPGKILMFLASLIASSLPITGFYIWWGRRNKKQRTEKIGYARVAETAS